MRAKKEWHKAVAFHSLLSTGCWGSFPGVSKLWCGVNCSPPSSAEVKKEWSYTSTPPVCRYGLDRDKFTSRALTGIFFKHHSGDNVIGFL